MVGTETIAGRTTDVIRLVPKQSVPQLQSARLWIDQQTRVPLKMEVIDSNGSVVMTAEYTQFNPDATVTADRFSYTPPQGAQVVTLTPQEIASAVGFENATLDELRAMTSYPVLEPSNLPAGVSLQATRALDYQNNTVSGLFYGSGQDITVALIEKPTNLSVPRVRGAEVVTIDGVQAELYEAGNLVVVDWVQGDTSLTLVSTLSRDETLDIARSVQ